MPTSDYDVVDALNQAAMDPPSMSLAPQSVLASAKGRRRKQRQTRGGMALAAFAAVGAVWLGSGPVLGEFLGTEVDSARPDESQQVDAVPPKEWDDTVAFEEPLPQDPSDPTQFRGARLVRDPGAGFTVTLAGDSEGEVLDPSGGDLPDGVSLFVHDGATLIVAEPSFAGPPTLDIGDLQHYVSLQSRYINDDPGSPHVWTVDGLLTTSDVIDIYWQLPDQTVASSGDQVLDEEVTVGSDTVDIMFVPSTGRWAQREEGSFGEVSNPGGAFSGVVTSGDLSVAVVPDDSSDPVWTFGGKGYDEDNRVVDKSVEVSASTRPLGDYLLAWGSFDRDQFIDETSFMGPSYGPDMSSIRAAVNVVDSADGVEVRVANSQSALSVATGEREPQVVQSADGSALVIAPFSEEFAEGEGRFGSLGSFPDVIVDTGGRLDTGLDLTFGPSWLEVELPLDMGLAGVALSPGALRDPQAEVLPTLLFDGPHWSGSRPSGDAEVGGITMSYAIEPDLGLWAVQCESGETPVAGRVGSAVATMVTCLDDMGNENSSVNGYAVAVLPTTEAATAQIVATSFGVEAVEALGEPTPTDIVDGLSLWVLPLGSAEQGTEQNLIYPIAGLDTDGDGKVDDPGPAN